MIDTIYLDDKRFQHTFPAGQLISGPAGRGIYIVVTGRVKTEYAGRVGFAGPGEAFGIREFFIGQGGNVFTAMEETTVFVVDEGNFRDVAAACPKVLYWLLGSAYVPDMKIVPT